MFFALSIGGFFVALVITVLVILVYLGFFDRVEVETGNPPIALSGKVFAYKAHRDTYSGIGFQFTKQYNFTSVQEPEIRSIFEKTQAVGIYYDSPNNKVQKSRFLVGLLLNDEANTAKVKQCLENDGYRFATLPDIDHVVHATFPFRSLFSLKIAFNKVYPLINSYLQVNLTLKCVQIEQSADFVCFLFEQENRLCAYPVMEVYTVSDIHFILPLSKQQDFYFYYKPESDDEDEEQESLDDSEVDALLNGEEENEDPDHVKITATEDDDNDDDDDDDDDIEIIDSEIESEIEKEEHSTDKQDKKLRKRK